MKFTGIHKLHPNLPFRWSSIICKEKDRFDKELGGFSRELHSTSKFVTALLCDFSHSDAIHWTKPSSA